MSSRRVLKRSFAAGRTVIVGDVHGCRDELETLLDRVQLAAADRLVLVGDLVVRGPDPHGVLALVKKLGGRAVRGNHETKLLNLRGKGNRGTEHELLAAALSDSEWRILEAMPFWLDLPDHGIRVVHGGVIPGEAIETTPPEAILTMRSVDSHGRFSADKDKSPLWGERYEGPPHVVFGHNALANPQLHAWATGIDTGCVYGRRLTAVVLEPGEPMPRGRNAVSKLVSVQARRAYSEPKGGR